MGIAITITDQALPASAALIRFLYATIKGEPHDTLEWYFQEGEGLIQPPRTTAEMEVMARTVAADQKAMEYLVRSYSLFRELLVGETAKLCEFSKFRFFFVIGVPRTGGTYLVKQLFRATDYDYHNVPNSVAHDGLPHLSEAVFGPKGNSRTIGLQQIAEYLTMVEIFFGGHKKLHSGGILVPKKFPKAVYDFNLVKEVFGANAEYLITLRHPLSVCKSIMDKSGGMPAGGKFSLRSNIEQWVCDDWVQQGVPRDKVLNMDYVKCILGYWKHYHFQMAMSGLPRLPKASVVPFGEESMTGKAVELYARFGLDMEPETFKKSTPPLFSGEDEKEAERTIEEVAAFWKVLDMEFPTAAIAARL